jgi:tyrosinase
MRTEITIFQNSSTPTNYLTWAPARAQVQLADPGDATEAVDVVLRNQNTRRGGQVVFSTLVDPVTPLPEMPLGLPLDGTPVDFIVAGQFGRPSKADHDGAIKVIEPSSGRVLSVTPLMVRIRKNANTLTLAERNRLRSALAILNDRGMGPFSDLRNVHTNAGSPEAHGRAGFLPWHRAYLLDLERELQKIDPSVALPYWRFDQPASRLFTTGFMGVPDAATGTLRFSADNPIQFWSTDGVTGLVRRPLFDTRTEGAFVDDEATTLALGGPGSVYELFRSMEGNPHGSAHVSFNGYINSIPTAARDPLFFMLHANVDRLWAKWQWFNQRFDAVSTNSYTFLGSAGSPGATRIGHNLNDSMWPWNQDTNPPRPPTAPGGQFPPSTVTDAPGLSPTIGALIDYQGVMSPANCLGFDYDDVPFEPV